MVIPPSDAPLSLAADFWLETRCRCGTIYTPIKLLAKRVGPQAKLGEVVARLRCEKCGQRPNGVALVDNPAAGAVGVPGGAKQVRIELGR